MKKKTLDIILAIVAVAAFVLCIVFAGQRDAAVKEAEEKAAAAQEQALKEADEKAVKAQEEAVTKAVQEAEEIGS